MTASSKIRLLSGLLFSTVHTAATSDSLDDEIKYLQAETYITTASRYQEKITDTPASVILITSQQIKQRRYQNLIDVLKDLPSVDIQEKRHQLEYNLITFRGHLHSNKFLILQDGVRIDSPTGEALAIAENFPLYVAKQIEILYGPAAAVYGTEAFSGVINIITQDPEDVNGVKVAGKVGNYDYYSGQLLTGKRFNDNFAIEVGGHFQTADYESMANQYPDSYAKVDAVTLAKTTYRSAAQREDFSAKQESNSTFVKMKLGQNLEIGYQRGYLDAPSTTGERPSRTVYDPSSRWITETNRVYGKYNLKFNDDFSANTLIYYSSYEIDPHSKFKNVNVDYIDSYIYAFGDKLYFEEQLQYKFNQDHKLTGGVLYEKFSSIPKTTDLPRPYNVNKSPNEQNLYHIGTNNTIPIEITKLNYDNIAGYFQLQSDWFKEFSTTLGLRYDHGSRYGGTFNPRVGFVYRPFNSTSFKMLYGEAFRAASPMDTSEIYGLFSGNKNAQGQYTSYFFRAPNPNLKPEKSRTLEFELSHFFSQNFNMSLSGYYTRLKNLIVGVDDTKPVQFIPNGEIYRTRRTQNLGSSYIYGLELSGNYLYKLTDTLNLNLWGNYSYINGKNSRQDSPIKSELVYVAPHKGKLGITLSYLDDYFATLKLRSISRTTTEVADPIQLGKMQKSPGYTLLDLHLGSKVYDGLSANLDFYNLLNKRYYAAGSSGAAFQYMPEPMLSVMFSLQYQY
jgi:outer membrane receptor for ferrienterochelin and colicin